MQRDDEDLNYIEKQHKWACQVVEDDEVWFYYKGEMCRGLVMSFKYKRFGEIEYTVEFRDTNDTVRCETCGSVLNAEEEDWDTGVSYYTRADYKQIKLSHHELINPFL